MFGAPGGGFGGGVGGEFGAVFGTEVGDEFGAGVSGAASGGGVGGTGMRAIERTCAKALIVTANSAAATKENLSTAVFTFSQ